MEIANEYVVGDPAAGSNPYKGTGTSRHPHAGYIDVAANCYLILGGGRREIHSCSYSRRYRQFATVTFTVFTEKSTQNLALANAFGP